MVKGSFQYDGGFPSGGGERLFVLGPAGGVWDEWHTVRHMPGDVMAINDIGMYITEDVRWWYSSHDDRLKAWCGVRYALHERRQKPALISCSRREGIDHWYLPLDDIKAFSRGSSIECSGVFAMVIGLLMGYEQVVLVGCPADGRGHQFHPSWREWKGYADPEAHEAWKQAIDRHPEILERVRSTSGITQSLLGSPTIMECV